MSIMSEEEILKEFLKKYNQNPLGWRMSTGISPAGHSELLITHPNYSWLIKRDSPYSGVPGIGGRLEGYLNPRLGVEQSGYRPIPRHSMKKIIAMVEEGIDPIEAIKIIGTILTQQPATFDELKRMRPPGVVQGPILHSYRPIQSIIGRQLELDLKLEAELEKLKGGRTTYIG